MPVPKTKKTETQKLNEKNAVTIEKIKEGAKKNAEAQIEVRDGKKTASEAFLGRAKKEVVTTVHAGGGIFVDIIDTPKKETQEQTMARVLLPKPDPKMPTLRVPKDFGKNLAIEALKEWVEWAGQQGADSARARKYYASRRVLKTVPVGEQVISVPLTGSSSATVVSQLPGMTIVTAGGKEETWSPNTDVEVVTGDVPPMSPSAASQTEFVGADISKPQIPSLDGKERNTRTATQRTGHHPNASMTPVPNGCGVPVCVGGGKATIYGHAFTRVIHTLASKGWDFEKVVRAIKRLGIADVKESSVRTAWNDGRNPKYAKPVDLTTNQIALLEPGSSSTLKTKKNKN